MRTIFEHPLWLALAAVFPLAIVALLAAWHRKRVARLTKLGTPEVVARLAPGAVVRAPAGRAARLAVAAACAGIAFAGPRWGVERNVVRGSGVDVVLALDASLSMLAPDERPSRLEREKQEVRRLRASSTGDRFAMLAFAGRSYILTPLTVDEGALDLFLDNLDPSVVGQAGSSLARAISQGTDLLSASKSGGDRALVIMSDGEAFEPEQDVVEAARQADEAGIALITVGFGTAAGSTIPVREGDSVTEKRDEEGNIVVTRYHPELLRAAAQAARGTFIDAAEPDKAGRIRAALRALRATSRSVEGARAGTPRFQLFLIPTLLLLLADTYLTERRARRRAGPAAAATAMSLLLVVMPLRAARADDAADAARELRAGRYGRAATLYRNAIAHGDHRPEVLYDYGTALLLADSLANAADILERATKATDAEIRFRALFNLGLVHLKRGLAAQGDSADASLSAALDTYKKALLMRSADRDAKWNYELALRKKKKNDGGGGGGGGGGGQQQSKASQPNPSPAQQQPQRMSGGLGQERAEELLNSAAREEKEVQGRKQKQSRAHPPPGGKDW